MAEARRGSTPPANHEIVIVNQTLPQRLDKFLFDRLPGKTRSYIQKLIRDGDVSVGDGRALKPSSRVRTGETVTVRIPPPGPSGIEPRFVPFDIIYEDEDLVALNKPAGIAVHPSPGFNETTLVHGLLDRIRDLAGIGGVDRPGIVHRLDRDTSGVMIVAKNDTAHHRLAMKFKARDMHKTYLAVCHLREPIGAGIIDMPIGRSLRNRKKMAIRYDGGRAAITEYEIARSLGPFALVEAFPRSGRTHQIRVHLSFMGLPIACDGVYGREKCLYASSLLGKPRTNDERPLIARQALHARSLTFEHPRTGRRLRVEAAVPPDLERLIGFLRRHFGA